MKKAKNGPSSKHHSLNEFCRALSRHKKILLACHIAPEGDAIGSILAMESLLRRMGKKTTVVAEDIFPERLFCLSAKRWILIDQVKNFAAYDAIVIADCPTLERTGRVRERLSPSTVIFNIDHHISNRLFGHYNYVRPEAAASGEVDRKSVV